MDKEGKKNGARQASKAEQLALRRKSRGGSEVADWGSVNGEQVVAVIAAATKHGYAVTFGYTRDFGAYTVRVLGDDSFETEYVRPTENVGLYLVALADDLESLEKAV